MRRPDAGPHALGAVLHRRAGLDAKPAQVPQDLELLVSGKALEPLAPVRADAVPAQAWRSHAGVAMGAARFSG